MHQPLVQHPFGPVLRPLAEASGDGAAGDLHPGAGVREIAHHLVVALDPGQAFWMGDQRLVARAHHLEDGVLQPRRRHMVRRFEQEIACPVQRRDAPVLQALRKARRDVHVRALHQLQGNLGLVQGRLQADDRGADARAGVLIHTRHDVRRAGGDPDAVVHGHARHGQRRFQIRSAVVDARKHMAVQIDHARGLPAFGTQADGAPRRSPAWGSRNCGVFTQRALQLCATSQAAEPPNRSGPLSRDPKIAAASHKTGRRHATVRGFLLGRWNNLPTRGVCPAHPSWMARRRPQ